MAQKDRATSRVKGSLAFQWSEKSCKILARRVDDRSNRLGSRSMSLELRVATRAGSITCLLFLLVRGIAGTRTISFFTRAEYIRSIIGRGE